MDVDSIRRYCLSFPHTKEKLQWGETLCFKVGEKIFTLLSLDVGSETRLSLKCAPERFAELIELEVELADVYRRADAVDPVDDLIDTCHGAVGVTST